MDASGLPRIPRRKPDAHKGDFGRVLVLAGSPRMTGAAWMSAQAALRAGAGLVTLGIPARIHPWLASRAVAEMTLPLPDDDEGVFTLDAVEPALEFLGDCDAFALGPGVGTHAETAAFVREIAVRAGIAGVVDADGLNDLAGHLDALRSAAGARVLTPHPGECARLLDRSVKEVQADREGAAEELAGRTGAVAVLKGNGTVVAGGGKRYINGTGNPGMASGGVGDVLTGVIAGLLAQGFAPFDAACLGAFVHGRAGDLATARAGETSCTASDVLDSLPAAFIEVTERDA